MAIFPELSRMELRGYRDCDVRSGVLEPIPRRPRVLSAFKGYRRQYRCCAHDLWVPGGATWTDQLVAPLPSRAKRCRHRGLRKYSKSIKNTLIFYCEAITIGTR